MARKLRIMYPGAIYHVMNRRDRREDIFRLTLKWIAARLRMGTVASLLNLLSAKRRKGR